MLMLFTQMVSDPLHINGILKYTSDGVLSSSSFNITDYITFNNGFTRSSSSGKLNHVRNSNNVNKHFFFNRIPRLWNALPPIDLSLSIATNKKRLYRFLLEHSLTNFNSDNPCTYHFVCPCSIDAPAFPTP